MDRMSSAIRKTTMNNSRSMRHNARYTKKDSGHKMTSETMPNAMLVLKAKIRYETSTRASPAMMSTYTTLTTLGVTNEVNPKSNSEATNPFALACAAGLCAVLDCSAYVAACSAYSVPGAEYPAPWVP